MRSSVWIIRRRGGGGSDDDDGETLPMFTKTQINAMPLEELKAAAIARKLVKPNTKAQIPALKKKLEGYVGAVTDTDKKNSGDNEKGFCPTIFSSPHCQLHTCIFCSLLNHRLKFPCCLTPKWRTGCTEKICTNGCNEKRQHVRATVIEELPRLHQETCGQFYYSQTRRGWRPSWIIKPPFCIKVHHPSFLPTCINVAPK